MTPSDRFLAHIRQMYTFYRKSDNKAFKTTLHSHWSDIAAEDGETDTVKFYGHDVQNRPMYVSVIKGHSYIQICHKEETGGSSKGIEQADPVK